MGYTITIFTFKNVKLQLRVPDHNPPHLHIVKGREELASIDLKTFEITGEGLSRKDMKRIEEYITNNYDKIIKKWEKFHGEEED